MAQRIKWIDQAKGLAILMVIAVHVSQALPLPPMANSFVCGLAVLQRRPFGVGGCSLEFMGKYSYEIFITHFFVIWVLRDMFS